MDGEQVNFRRLIDQRRSMIDERFAPAGDFIACIIILFPRQSGRHDDFHA